MRATRRQVLAGSTAAVASLALRRTGIKAQDKSKIRWWHISTADAHKAAFQAKADAFVALHPEVEIEITVLENAAFKTKLATAMQSGDPPDVFQSWGGGVLYQYAEAGLVKDITADLAKDGWGDNFLPAPLGLYANNGANYGVPWNVGMVGVWYNKALFAQAAIESTPTTWTEYLDTVGKLKAAGITPITVGEMEKWPGHFYWVYLAIRAGGKAAFDAAYTRTGSFTDAPFVEAGTRLKELVDLQPFQEGFLGTSYPDASAIIANGKAAMELMGQWSPAVQKDNAENKTGLGDDLGYFTFPTLADGAGNPTDALGGCDGYAIGKNAPDSAIEFVRYLLSLEVQTDLAGQGIAVLPVIKGAEAAITDPNLTAVKDALAQATYLQLYYDQFLPPAVGAVVNDATQAIFAGTASPEDAAQMIEDSAAQEITS
jgi:raffinose/stachyose/melibiose transport system substrate-binding protein